MHSPISITSDNGAQCMMKKIQGATSPASSLQSEGSPHTKPRMGRKNISRG